MSDYVGPLTSETTRNIHASVRAASDLDIVLTAIDRKSFLSMLMVESVAADALTFLDAGNELSPQDVRSFLESTVAILHTVSQRLTIGKDEIASFRKVTNTLPKLT